MSQSRGLLGLYWLASLGLRPFAPLFLRRRIARGKEDPIRYREKLGEPGRERPSGSLVWLHGASVGEGLALLPLIEQLTGQGLKVLVTTGTLSSARILDSRLGPSAAHQFMPLDSPVYIDRFLDHWRPDLVLFAESELWPNIFERVARRGLPLVLVNARLSERSAQRWLRVPRSIAAMLACVDLCIAQTDADAVRLARLGASRVQVAGNLKYDVPAPPVDNALLAELNVAIGARPVWLAASTHAGEEAQCASVHDALRSVFPDILTLIAPRHAERGAAIGEALQQSGLNVQIRSRGEPIEAATDIYLADTMGEMGLFYRAAPIVFVGKSMAVPTRGGPNEAAVMHRLGGQNPIEPAKLGSAILHGPHIGNFGEVYQALDEAGGAVSVADSAALTQVLTQIFKDAALMRKMARAAHRVVEEFSGATARTMQALEPYIEQIQARQP